MANNDKTEKPAVRIEKANNRINNDLGKVQQFAKRLAKVLTKETTEEAEDTTVDASQKTIGTAGTETPQSSGSKRKTQNSKKAGKQQPTEQEKLVRAARMGELQEMVEEHNR